MLNSCVLLLLAVTHCNEIVGIPQRHFGKRSLAATEPSAQVIIKETEKLIPIVGVVASSRKKKGPTLPLSISVQHQLLVPSLHVIPISNVHRVHAGLNDDSPTIISHTVAHTNTSIARPQLLPVLIPIHNHLVPIHDLTVIPLHSVVHKDTKVGFKISESHHGEESINNYRNPLGGYGAGWYYGGHGAGHGFHYSYG